MKFPENPRTLISALALIAVPALVITLLLGAGGTGSTQAGERDAAVHRYLIELDDAGTYLGVRLEEETDDPEGGARVVEVFKESPAERAGFEAGDIIRSVDGRQARGPRGVIERVHARDPGDSVSIGVQRGGRSLDLDVELGDRSEMHPWVVGGSFEFDTDSEDWQEWQEQLHEKMEHLGERLELQLGDAEHWEEFGRQMEQLGERLGEQFSDLQFLEEHYAPHFNFDFSGYGRPLLGVQLVAATPELREHLGGDAEVGVLVGKVISGTPADAAGIRVGDLIVAVDGEPIEDVGDLRRALRESVGRTFPVEVVRDGGATTLDVEIPESDEPSNGPRAFFVPVPSAPRVPAVPHPPHLAIPTHVAPRLEMRVPRSPSLPLPPALPAPPAPPARPVSERTLV